MSKKIATGYKKRLARRLSGNPGPRQMWVPAYIVNSHGVALSNPLAAKKVSAEEIAQLRREEEAPGGSL